MGIPAADGNSNGFEYGRSYYTVREGDNLTIISKATGFPISVIAEVNGIKDVNKIEVGQKLVFVHETSYDLTGPFWPTSPDQDDWVDMKNEETGAQSAMFRVGLVNDKGAQEYVKKMNIKI